MSRKNRNIHVATITPEMQFAASKPQYNGYACGHGAHRNKRAYNRRDKSWRKEAYNG